MNEGMFWCSNKEIKRKSIVIFSVIILKGMEGKVKLQISEEEEE
jgi:hypothetical protein